MINVDKHIGIPLKRGGAAMKKKSISAFVITGLLSVLLSGCQGKEEAGGGVLEDTSKPVISMEGKHTEEENDGKAEAGFQAVLMGTALMEGGRPGEKLAAILEETI